MIEHYKENDWSIEDQIRFDLQHLGLDEQSKYIQNLLNKVDKFRTQIENKRLYIRNKK